MNAQTGHDHPDHDCQEIFAALSEYLDGELWLSDQPEPELFPAERQRICEAFRRRCGHSGGQKDADSGDAE